MKKVAQLKVGGNKFDIVDQIDWSKVDYILCGETSYFDDDVSSVCSKCNKEIVSRPYVPNDVVKICLDCI